jgi:hypothetical protein
MTQVQQAILGHDFTHGVLDVIIISKRRVHSTVPELTMDAVDLWDFLARVKFRRRAGSKTVLESVAIGDSRD